MMETTQKQRNISVAEANHIRAVKNFAAYVDENDRIVGIYSTNKDYLTANRSTPLRLLKLKYGWKIQTVIPNHDILP